MRGGRSDAPARDADGAKARPSADSRAARASSRPLPRPFSRGGSEEEGGPTRAARAWRWLSPDSPWQLALGFTLWSLWFVGVYGGVSVACAARWAADARGPWNGVNGALIAGTLATLVLLLLAARRCLRHARALRRLDPAGPRRPARPADAVGQAEADQPPAGEVPESAFDQRLERRRFIAFMAALLHALAAASTVFVALPLLRLPPCL